MGSGKCRKTRRKVDAEWKRKERIGMFWPDNVEEISCTQKVQKRDRRVG